MCKQDKFFSARSFAHPVLCRQYQNTGCHWFLRSVVCYMYVRACVCSYCLLVRWEQCVWGDSVLMMVFYTIDSVALVHSKSFTYNTLEARLFPPPIDLINLLQLLAFLFFFLVPFLSFSLVLFHLPSIIFFCSVFPSFLSFVSNLF